MTYPEKQLIDLGASGYSSMQQVDGKLLLLYEQADPEPLFTVADRLKHWAIPQFVQLPLRFVFREVKTQNGFVSR